MTTRRKAKKAIKVNGYKTRVMDPIDDLIVN